MLQRGQKMKLADLLHRGAFQVKVMVKMATGEADLACFGVDAQQKLSDDRYFIFYNQLQSPEGALKIDISTASTVFDIDLQKLPNSIQKLVFTVTAEEVGMAALQDGQMQIIQNNEIVETFSFCGKDFDQQKAIILCEVYQKDNQWRLSMVVNGFNAGLSALLAHFGGEEVKEEVPAEKELPKQTVTAKAEAQPVPKEPLKKVSLSKKGDSHKIDLSKNSQRIRVNLNWNQTMKKGLFGVNKPIDLDLACLYRLKDGRRGIVQALGNAFGSDFMEPFIKLDQDDRTGTSVTGENMYFYKPELIDFAVIFAYIYEGVPNWNKTDATIVLQQEGSPEIELSIKNGRPQDRYVVFASLTNGADGLNIVREERFFNSHMAVDQHYGFGLRWRDGHK